mmetsp:Transcript_7826/g.16808  ORF Transcript_7826/g.16808 Transcript_7826/m.16808 type:complete len:249 (-) Transcript_7826:47-793(-)
MKLGSMLMMKSATYLSNHIHAGLGTLGQRLHHSWRISTTRTRTAGCYMEMMTPSSTCMVCCGWSAAWIQHRPSPSAITCGCLSSIRTPRHPAVSLVSLRATCHQLEQYARKPQIPISYLSGVARLAALTSHAHIQLPWGTNASRQQHMAELASSSAWACSSLCHCIAYAAATTCIEEPLEVMACSVAACTTTTSASQSRAMQYKTGWPQHMAQQPATALSQPSLSCSPTTLFLTIDICGNSCWRPVSA